MPSEPIDGSGAAKKKLGSRIDEQLYDFYGDFVRYRNDGVYKRRLGNAVERALKRDMALYFWRHPNELQEIADSDVVDVDEEFVEFVKSEMDAAASEFVYAARIIEPQLETANAPGRQGGEEQPTVPARNQPLPSARANTSSAPRSAPETADQRARDDVPVAQPDRGTAVSPSDQSRVDEVVGTVGGHEPPTTDEEVNREKIEHLERQLDEIKDDMNQQFAEIKDDIEDDE